MSRYELRPIGAWDRERTELVRPGSPGWQDYEAWIAQGNVADLPSTVASLDLNQAIAARVAEVEEIAARERGLVVNFASPAEMASWCVKLQEARDYRTTKLYTGQLLQIEAEARGVTLDEIVDRVLGNANAYSRAEGLIAGISGRHKDAIRACAKLEELALIDVEDGWPSRPPRKQGALPPSE